MFLFNFLQILLIIENGRKAKNFSFFPKIENESTMYVSALGKISVLCYQFFRATKRPKFKKFLTVFLCMSSFEGILVYTLFFSILYLKFYLLWLMCLKYIPVSPFLGQNFIIARCLFIYTTDNNRTVNFKMYPHVCQVFTLYLQCTIDC